MASLAGVTDQLQRQNQQELASVIRIANEQLVSSGARQGLDEIAKIIEANVRDVIFSLKNKYPKIAKNKICVEIIKLVFATVVLYIAKT